MRIPVDFIYDSASKQYTCRICADSIQPQPAKRAREHEQTLKHQRNRSKMTLMHSRQSLQGVIRSSSRIGDDAIASSSRAARRDARQTAMVNEPPVSPVIDIGPIMPTTAAQAQQAAEQAMMDFCRNPTWVANIDSSDSESDSEAEREGPGETATEAQDDVHKGLFDIWLFISLSLKLEHIELLAFVRGSSDGAWTPWKDRLVSRDHYQVIIFSSHLCDSCASLISCPIFLVRCSRITTWRLYGGSFRPPKLQIHPRFGKSRSSAVNWIAFALRPSIGMWERWGILTML